MRSLHRRDHHQGADSAISGIAPACTTVFADFRSLPPQFVSRCRRIALLSIVPGLGQLRNGELAKGWLFLGVTATNIMLVLMILAGDRFKAPLSSLAAAFHRQANWTAIAPAQIGSACGGPVFCLYALLIASFVAYAVRDAYDQAVAAARSGQPLPRARLDLPEATSGSYLLHLAIMATFALSVILFITPRQPAQQITQIEMVREPAKAKTARKAAPAPHKPKIVQPRKVVTPKPVVHPIPVVHPVVAKPVEKPKPAPVAVAVPTKQPAPLQTAPVEAAAPLPATTAPVPAAGTAGGAAAGGGSDDAEVDMGPYMRELQRRIKQHWYPPKGNENKRIKVSFTVYKDGHIGKVKLTGSSGVSIADDAALQALQDASPFAALPPGAGDDIDINFTFDYHVFGGG